MEVVTMNMKKGLGPLLVVLLALMVAGAAYAECCNAQTKASDNTADSKLMQCCPKAQDGKCPMATEGKPCCMMENGKCPMAAEGKPCCMAENGKCPMMKAGKAECAKMGAMCAGCPMMDKDTKAKGGCPMMDKGTKPGMKMDGCPMCIMGCCSKMGWDGIIPDKLEAPKNAEWTSKLKSVLDKEVESLAKYKADMNKFELHRPYMMVVHQETRHIAWVKGLLDAYGMDYKTKDYAPKASESAKEALTEGLKMENDLVATYDWLIEKSEDETAKKVLKTAQFQSKMHAALFERSLETTTKKSTCPLK